MTRKPRRWDAVFEEDPGGGLLNLFDVWIAFSVALLLALFGYIQSSTPPSTADQEAPNSLVKIDPLRKALKAPRFRPTNTPLTGEGTRLGMAYQLKSGEVVYVPEEVNGKSGAGTGP